MRYRLRIVRAQSLERVVRAVDEEAAVKKVQEELERPYSFLGPWTIDAIEVEVLGVEAVPIGATDPVTGEALLLTVAEAAKRLGISQSTLRQLIASGEMEHVRVGRRILLSRTGLQRFIEANTRTGYSY
ncbi:MAG TPA: helix-turn-helix domain-containing protein [Acidimicrobiales bacterium]|nr:helix-turn-helix domain-containing protein [Acidimicrobiales bacterium]